MVGFCCCALKALTHKEQTIEKVPFTVFYCVSTTKEIYLPPLYRDGGREQRYAYLMHDYKPVGFMILWRTDP